MDKLSENMTHIYLQVINRIGGPAQLRKVHTMLAEVS